MAVPGHAGATASAYINSAYFSYDNGKTRYPVYYVEENGTPIGLATRFTPPANETENLRLDTLNLFMDMNAAVTSAATYLDEWDNKKTDVNGFAYFTPAANQAAAPVVIGPSYSYYLKGGVFFELKDADNKDVYTARIEEPEEDFYENKVKNGWLNLGDNNHILLNDAEHPNNQYDVEIVANDAFYTAFTTGYRVEDNKELTLKAQFSNRKNFTFTDPQYFTWTSSDPEIAKVETDEQGVAHIALTGKTGEVTFTLNVGNCVASKAYDVPVTAKLTVLEGKTPFLNISKYSQQRVTLTETPVDISFASNLTARNAHAGREETVFTATLKKDGEELWTGIFTSTLDKPISHITVPGDKLTAKGEYTVEISASYVGGEVEGAATTAQELSATANITVKQAPAKITLDKLDSYYVTADDIPQIKYTASNDAAEVQYTIQKSGGELGDRKNAADGTIPFNVDAPTNLKESYTITVYARNAGTDDAWSVDSMLLTVYNPVILEQIVKDVTAGQIGGTTGGVGVDVEGETVDLDNHGKISGTYGVDEAGEYKLTFNDFTTLRTDMSLQKIISINYGEQVYGLLSDKMQWESSDSSLASVNYKQGGIYSDLRNYSYTSYTPATDFLLVAKDNINASDEVTITATHANTGIKSSFNVTASTLKDQLYLFKFNPAVETDVTYTNGDGEKRVLKSNDKGELAVYEPSGIASSVMTMSKVGNNKTYVGTLYPSDLATGERDIASLQLYPCNNLRLRAIANADLTFIKPDGTPYNGAVTIRGGVYKNGVYCPGAKIRISGESVDSAQIGRENINATVTNGKLNLTLDPFQFNVDLNYYGTVVLEAKVGTLGGSWDIDFCGGTVGTNFEAKYDWSQNFMCGPVPVNISFTVTGTADLEVSFANKADARALLIDAAVGVSIDAFAGLGFDYSLVALKLGIFGNIGAKDNFLYLTDGNQTANKLDISGEIGIKLAVKIAMVSYEKVFCSTGFKWSKTWGDYEGIKEQWKEKGFAELSGTTNGGRAFTMRLLSNGTAMVSVDGENTIENRNYLASAPRLLKGLLRGSSTDGMTTLQDNAYPYSNPVVNDDGSVMLYISDNNNADELQSVVHYAVKDGDSYRETENPRVDTSKDNILKDFDVVASGTSGNTFAAWIKQMDSPDKEMNDKATYDDLGMMLNATEICVSRYDGTGWTTQQLTNNAMADMSPSIASSGDKAIVAWRSLSATEMPEDKTDGSDTNDITGMFNAENSINYSIFNGTKWVDAKVAYNGSAGTVNAIDSAMLNDGTALIVYTVRTGDDVKTSETFYTLINPHGEVVTTGHLTNDGYTDTNAQVSAVGDQFIVGWYSEHEAGEENGTKETVVSHDIGLARINKNGSVDAKFPQSIGGTSDSRIGSDFHFSAPANNNDLSNLSIVWSQQKESDKADDAGKYQLNAVRFYKNDNVIGVTAPTKIAETNKNYAIDKFDTYTDGYGKVNAILIGSDYSNIEGLSTYDTIDLTNFPVQTVDETGTASNLLNILDAKPISSIKLAQGAFQQTAIEAEANIDLYSLMPGIEQPVQFAVKNTGTSKISTVSVQFGIDAQNIKTFTDMDLLPGQSTVLTANYNVPENVQDVAYTLTADNIGTATGTLVLNRPDVGISSMKITTESDKQRNVQLILKNASEIPLVGSGKTVKLAFYKDAEHTQKIGENDITIDQAAYNDIDNDLYVYNKTIDVSSLIGNAAEIPEEGVRIYAHVWVEDVDELYTEDNDASVTFKSLLTKYQSQITMDSALVENNDGTYSFNANISNNSLQDTEVGSITADILDNNNKVIDSVELTDNDLTLSGEHTEKLTTATKRLSKAPASVALRSSAKTIILDPGRGSCDAVSMELNADNKIGSVLPAANRSGYVFSGWYTKASGGEKVTNDTVLEGGATIYAHYSYQYYSQCWTLTMDSYEYDGTAHTPTFINGEPQGRVHYTYYDADTNKLLAAAPSTVGNYKVQVYAEGGSSYYGKIQTVKYSISEPAVTLTASINTAVNPKKPDVKYVKYTFERNVADDAEITAEGYVYVKDTVDTLTVDTEGATVKTVETTNKTGTVAIAVPDEGDGTTAVGFIVVNGVYIYSDVVSKTYEQATSGE